MMMMNSSSIGGISEINYMAEEVAKELPNNHFMKRRKTKQESQTKIFAKTSLNSISFDRNSQHTITPVILSRVNKLAATTSLVSGGARINESASHNFKIAQANPIYQNPIGIR